MVNNCRTKPKPGRAMPPQPMAAVDGMARVNAETQQNQEMANGVTGNMLTMIQALSAQNQQNRQAIAANANRAQNMEPTSRSLGRRAR